MDSADLLETLRCTTALLGIMASDTGSFLFYVKPRRIVSVLHTLPSYTRTEVRYKSEQEVRVNKPVAVNHINLERPVFEVLYESMDFIQHAESCNMMHGLTLFDPAHR